MRILAIEASTEASSVALMNGTEVIFRMQDSGRSQAEGLLAWVRALLAESGTALAELDAIAASVGPGAFTGVRVGVAVAQGLAFGADLPVVPVMTLETLAYHALAEQLAAGSAGGTAPAGAGVRYALPCLDARMGEVYWGCFAADARRGVCLEGRAAVGQPATVALPAAHGSAAAGAPAPSATGEPSPAALVASARDGRRYRAIGRGFSVYPELARIPGVQLQAEDALRLPHAADLAALAALRAAAGEAIDPADLSPVYLRDKVAFTEAERAGK
jgi:tRNA threonylcarbamoyladenosine biosynthesis protein TsaB